MSPPPRAVSFDFGQTLAELDTELLARRLAERGHRLEATRLERATPEAWRAYARAKRAGQAGRAAWCSFMRRLLEQAGVPGSGPLSPSSELAEWLWTEQPRLNLWRRPLPGMLALVEALTARGTPLAVVSNSEGRLSALLDELGWAARFGVVVDSGALGFEKPDPRMFERAAAGLGAQTAELVHIGDSWEADVEGALGAGAWAVLFGGPPPTAPPARARACASSTELRALLEGWQLC